jgi:hypothetical protein
MTSSTYYTRHVQVARAWILGFLFLAAVPALADPALRPDRELIPDTAVAIPKLQIDGAGTLVIEASPSSSEHDFDFLTGNWKLRNRKLAARLVHSDEWIAFESRVEMHQILDGVGNIDKYTEMVSGKPYEGVALRLFNTRTKLWSIYWADSKSGALDPPVVGSFANKVGHFFARDTYKGQKIIVVFRWDVRHPQRPIWSQAFSMDEGKTWEWNSINVSEHVE